MRISLLTILTLLLCSLLQLLQAQPAEDWMSYQRGTQINGQFEMEADILLATDAGVAVFDKSSGEITDRWTRKTHALPSNLIEAVLVEPATGSFVIGTYDLGVFISGPEANDSWVALPFPEDIGGPGNPVKTYCLAYDNVGRLLVGTNFGLLIREENDWLRYGSTESDGLINEVWEMVTAPNGTVFAGGNILLTVTGDTITRLTPAPITPQNFDSLHFSYSDRKLHILPNGSLWSMTDIGEVALYDADGNWTLYGFHTGNQPIFFSLFATNFVTPDGKFFVEDNDGTYFYHADTGWVSSPPPFSFEQPEFIFTLEGNYYGQRADTIYALSPTEPATFSGTLSNWPWGDRVFDLFTEPGGDTWAKLGNERIINLTTEEVLQLPLGVNGLTYYVDFAFANDGSQDIWLRNYGEVFKWENRETLVSFPYAAGSPASTGSTRNLVLAEDGTPWFSNSNQQVYYLDNGEWRQRFTHPNGTFVYDLIPFGGDQILMFTYGSGSSSIRLATPTDSEIYHFPPSLPVETFYAPFKTNEAGNLWFLNGDITQLINFDNGVISLVDLPEAWPNEYYFQDFQEIDGNLLIATNSHIGFYNGSEWLIYNHDNTPFETGRINTAAIDQAGTIRVSHNNQKWAMEILETDLLNSINEGNLLGQAQTQLLVFPNPVQGALSFNSTAGQQYRLYGMDGRLLQSGIAKAGSNRLDVSGLSAGNYLLRLVGEGGAQVAKFVVVW